MSLGERNAIQIKLERLSVRAFGKIIGPRVPVSCSFVELLPQDSVLVLIVFADRVEINDLIPFFACDVLGVMLKHLAAIFAPGRCADGDVEVGKDRNVGQSVFGGSGHGSSDFLLLWEGKADGGALHAIGFSQYLSR